MRSVLRRLLVVMASVCAVALLVVIAGWVLTEIRIRKVYTDVPPTAPSPLVGNIPAGKHWATILGCTDCHAHDLGGQVLDESFLLGHLVAPNLTLQRKLYGDAELVRVIRYGIKRNGHGALIMPSDGFYHLDDQTVADVIAYLRSVPDVKRNLPPLTVGPLLRFAMLTGKFDLAANSIDRHAPRLGDAPHTTPLQQGRYIAVVACTECHGIDQQGRSVIGAPDLAVAKAYSTAEFTELMHHGWAKGHHDVGFMSKIARDRFVAFDDSEIGALKAYLDARPAQNPTPPH